MNGNDTPGSATGMSIGQAVQTKTAASFGIAGLFELMVQIKTAIADGQLTPEEIIGILAIVFGWFGVVSIRRAVGK